MSMEDDGNGTAARTRISNRWTVTNSRQENGEEWIFSILFGFDKKSHRTLFQSRVIRSSNIVRQKIYIVEQTIYSTRLVVVLISADTEQCRTIQRIEILENDFSIL